MEHTKATMITVTTLLFCKASECYNKYGTYAKWGVYGLVTCCALTICIEQILERYYDRKFAQSRDSSPKRNSPVIEEVEMPAPESNNPPVPEEVEMPVLELNNPPEANPPVAEGVEMPVPEPNNPPEANSPVAEGVEMPVPEPNNPPEANPPVAAAVPVPIRIKRPMTFRGLYGLEDIPGDEDRAVIDAYVARHLNLSEQFRAENDAKRGMYHATLAIMIQPDPEAFFEMNNGHMPVDVANYARRNLQLVKKMMENQTLLDSRTN